MSDENPDDTWVLGADYATSNNSRQRGGHHYVPREIYRDREFTEEVRKIFRDGTTGKLVSGPHIWSPEHYQYNKAAKEHLSQFLESRNIGRREMTQSDAKEFLDEILNSENPRIKDFNLKIHIMEIIARLMLRGRGPRGKKHWVLQ